MASTADDAQRLADDLSAMIDRAYEVIVEEDARGPVSLFRLEVEATDDDAFDRTYTLLLVPPGHEAAAMDALAQIVNPA